MFAVGQKGFQCITLFVVSSMDFFFLNNKGRAIMISICLKYKEIMNMLSSCLALGEKKTNGCELTDQHFQMPIEFALVPNEKYFEDFITISRVHCFVLVCWALIDSWWTYYIVRAIIWKWFVIPYNLFYRMHSLSIL